METLWEIGHRTLRNRADLRFGVILKKLSLRQRIDPLLIGSLTLAILVLVLGSCAAVSGGRRMGWFDQELFQKVPDPRKLTNVRDDLPVRKLLDGVYHEPEGRVFISQQGGTIHRYNPATGLWATDMPFSDKPVSLDFVSLRSGCGTDPLSVHKEECPDPNSMWLLGADGSLARHRSGQWEIVLNNTSFKGANGQSVSTEELTAAAVSDGERWLVIGTVDNGIGIYDLENRSWLSLASKLFEDLPSKEIDQIVFWRDRFWIGTQDGLASLAMHRNGPEIIRTEITGQILDLDVEVKEERLSGLLPNRSQLWVLAEKPCQKVDEECLWLGLLKEPNDSPIDILDERNRYTDLSLSTVNHAQYWDGALVLAGEVGIYKYDSVLHSWDRKFGNQVNTVLPEADGRGFYFGYPGGIGNINDSFEIASTWPITNESVIKLIPAAQDLLALTESGNVYATSGSKDVKEVFHRDRTNIDLATFSSALATEDIVLLIGPDGALLHNVQNRRYDDLSPEDIPTWILNPEMVFINAGGTIFAVDQGKSRTIIRTLPAEKIADASFYTSGEIDDLDRTIIPEPAQQIWPWGQDDLGIITEDGQLYRVSNGKYRAQLSGRAEKTIDQLTDVVQINDELIMASGVDLHTYNLSRRAWSEFSEPVLLEGELIVELAALDSRLLLSTDQGRLLQDSSSRPVLIGDPDGMDISDEGLSDAIAEGSIYYLAGEGRVVAYDSNRRRIMKRWVLNSGADVLLKGILDSMPLALSDGVAWLGDTALEPEAGRVIHLSHDDNYIWTIRETAGLHYLMGHALDSSTRKPRCFFRRPWAYGSTSIEDARVLSGEVIIAATNAGLQLYEPKARSWYQVAPDPLPRGGADLHARGEKWPSSTSGIREQWIIAASIGSRVEH